ncbi:toprim domain-containing protein [Legionella sainthelensi]|uniref:toprim domain-containing protein n=1 Tax=Legionella sainthelensi TaxID=28087 RepID=UPI000E201799|nr:toprim domain-containing protein [Legionella sainthelensi]
MNSNLIIKEFQSEMLATGIKPPENIIPNAVLQRFYVKGDKPSSKNGWYVLSCSGLPHGAFGDWKTGLSRSWHYSLHNFRGPHAFINVRKEFIESIEQYKRQKETDQNIAAKVALQKWAQSKPAHSYHPYLRHKRILPFNARQTGKWLILPIMDLCGKIWSLQFIDGTGFKQFLYKGRIKGNFIPLQKINSKRPFLLCESFSTAATLAQINTEFQVIAASNAGNLKAVALNIRKHFPDNKIIICADDDRCKPVNIGMQKANEAAIAAGAFLAKPNWSANAPADLTNFNDLAVWLMSQENAA